MGRKRRARRLRHRQPHLKRCIWSYLHKPNPHLYERHALRLVHVRYLHTRNSDLHTTFSANTNHQLPHRTNRNLDPRSHLKLPRWRHFSRMECVDGHGEYVHSDCDMHPPRFSNTDRRMSRRADRLNYPNPHFELRCRRFVTHVGCVDRHEQYLYDAGDQADTR